MTDDSLPGSSSSALQPPVTRRIVNELTVRVVQDLVDPVSAWLFEFGAQGVEEREVESAEEGEWGCLVVYGEDAGSLTVIGQALEQRIRELRESGAIGEEGQVQVAVRSYESDDWETEWLRHLRPVLIGDTLVIQPSWDDSLPPGKRRRILVEPRLAFGDGSHPTTLLASESVERYCLAHPGISLLDVGTGSGVLGLVALVCGAQRVVATDIDQACVDAAVANARLNGLESGLVASLSPLEEVPGQFDLVVANIDQPTLLQLMPGLVAHLAPGGQLVLTGILAGQTDAIQERLVALGLETLHEEQHRDWALLELARSLG